jgi:hypothetical protein
MHLRSCVLVACLVPACDSGSPSASDPTVDPSAHQIGVSSPAVGAEGEIDLEGTGALIRDNKVKDAKALERSINDDPKNRVDVDADGKPDKLQVVEERKSKGRRFRVRALPSSQPRSKPDTVAVAVAEIDVVPEDDHAVVSLRHAHADQHVVVFEAPIVVGAFCHWVLLNERPVYIGPTYVVVHKVHHKYRKHKKHKHKKW